VIEMQLIDIPESPRLRGEKAIEALFDLVDELEEHRGEELTDKQTTALIKFARGLISSIESETQVGTSEKDIKEMTFVNQLKKTIMRHIPRSFRTYTDGRLWKLSR
jgi:Fic family protein